MPATGSCLRRPWQAVFHRPSPRAGVSIITISYILLVLITLLHFRRWRYGLGSMLHNPSTLHLEIQPDL